ncbi:FkbM family methyltransferase [Pseudomonas putida]|uniref:FkbM family methyltransferase n=1 Tax=unclassified Pseudomonas TaxID=196821 RepID=UPI002555A058|nr:FkbM family methyltransferase [Pseudomonas sp. M2(2023)]MDY4312260.1 FkbM family methyltransferase [Pseudomonas putida]MDY4322546.1 FkbM family methyltransferase [Pseudomonas putida]MDY4355936.1 FkbM family methyltransferase [Pseudomonas putida]WIV25321.1 FkbM family methyltransferase [Pseudomonas sp. M2(2023)]
MPNDQTEQLLPLIKTEGEFTITIGEVKLSLHLTNKHERQYAANCAAGIKYPQADIDKFLFQNFIKPGDLIIDAGANIGFSALQMIAAGAKKVYCFEPVKELFNRLSQIQTDKIVAHNFGLSSTRAQAEIIISSSHNQGSTYSNEMIELFPQVFGDQPSKQRSKVLPLDYFFSDRDINFIKIDVEGLETEVLIGAKKLLSRRSLRTIVLESYTGTEEINKVLGDRFPLRYRVYLDSKSYDLKLQSPDEPISPNAIKTSPTYLFTNDLASVSLLMKSETYQC